MNVKHLLFRLCKPVITPITRAILRRHYHGSQPVKNIGSEQNVLIIAPHMDDESIGLGGTIRLHAESGSKIHCLFVTDGSRSVSDYTGTELSAVRKKEMERVKPILGITSIEYLDFPDGTLKENAKQLADQLTKVITTFNPDIIYCTTYVDAHPDHVTSAEQLARALERLPDKNPVLRLYEINCPFPPDKINCIIDISRTMKDKRLAIRQFRSQVIAFDGFLELNRLKANLTTKKVEAAEVFLEMTKQELIENTMIAAERHYNYPGLFKQANRTVTLLWAVFKNLRLKKKIYQSQL
ncbi:PIG-L deacetylase family protein [Sediminibacillus massiliensis]|uniref:PIG-L deacetylase family protein n=1 Tax=Sediminibacillus massiliensis TaxID=1926277 RepID=UPI0009884089|nr:PIG-L family deacetylase [Sediminibacillus massiliensis]